MELENDLIAYESAVEVFARNKTNHVIYNSGEDHARIITVNIFNNAQNKIRILAGSLTSKGVADKEIYINSLLNFIITRKGKVEILLDRYFDENIGESINKSSLFSALSNYKENVTVKGTRKKAMMTGYGEDPQTPRPIHFCLGDDHMYRLEYDTFARKAFCNFNDASFTERCIAAFDSNFQDATLHQL